MRRQGESRRVGKGAEARVSRKWRDRNENGTGEGEARRETKGDRRRDK